MSDTATRKSAWVPAGCLLETSVPPLTLPGAGIPRQGFSPYNASAIPIEPAYLVSISTLGIALMDYSRNGSDELDVKKDDQLRILKRYNHCEFFFPRESLSPESLLTRPLCFRELRNQE